MGENITLGVKWGLRQDKVEGLKSYHRALDSGDGMAAFYLGLCCLQGDFVDHDVGKSLYSQLSLVSCTRGPYLFNHVGDLRKECST